jgi:tetratricopeptide (TPR) repeat protein
MTYNMAAIRELVTAALGRDELRALCSDYFSEVYEELTDGQTKTAQVLLLVNYARRQGRLDELLQLVRVENPRQYEAFKDRLRIVPVKTEPAPSDRLLLEPVPVRPRFVGRERELALYRRMLAGERFVIISGLAGVGKTTLGARLAQEVAANPDQIFWFTFDNVQKNSAEALLRALAVFLKSHGQPDLAQYLDGEISTQKPLDLTARLNLFIAGLGSGDYLLCFDDFHLVKEHPDIGLLFKQIRDRYPGPRAPLPARFIIMGRDVPQAMQYLMPEPLGGLNEDDTRTFLQVNGVTLSSAQLQRLWRATTGNAKLLELCILLLARLTGDTAAVDNFLQSMPRQHDLREFVMDEIYAALAPKEKIVAGALSIFPTTVEQVALEAVLTGADPALADWSNEDVADIADLLHDLADKHIVTETPAGQIGCHSLVREYSYRLLTSQTSRCFHGRAAAYYEQQRRYVAAAYHHLERGVDEAAADLLAAHCRAVIYAGEAGVMLEQLARFRRERLTPPRWVAICQARGAAHEIRGENQLALQAYGAGLEDAGEERTRAELLRQIGHVYLVSGDPAQAIAHCRQSQEISAALNDQAGIADAHHDMGWAAYRLGRLADADAHFAASLAGGERLGDRLRQAKADLGLGAIRYSAGRMEEAQARYEAARRGFRLTGERMREARALNNLGLISLALGDRERALASCEQAVVIWREIGDIDGLRTGINNIGYTHLQSGNYKQAIEAYEQLASLAQATGHRRMLSIAYAGLADAQRSSGDLTQALTSAQTAHREALESGSQREIGVSLRTLGMAWLESADVAQAIACLEQCIPILEELHENDDLAQARVSLAAARLQSARTTSARQ